MATLDQELKYWRMYLDWAAVMNGEMNRFNAWTSGKIKMDGDRVLYQQLEDVIDRAWKTET